MEILLWLVPAGILTCATMLWVGWWGREGRGEIDRETAARRLGEALGKPPRHSPGYAVPRPAPDRSTGVALRRTRPRVLPALRREEPAEVGVVEPAVPTEAEQPRPGRRAS